jgi:hypothetical protein
MKWAAEITAVPYADRHASLFLKAHHRLQLLEAPLCVTLSVDPSTAVE